MSTVNDNKVENLAHSGEVSSGFNAVSAISDLVSDYNTALDASTSQLQALHQSLIDLHGSDSIDFGSERGAIPDQNFIDLRDQLLAKQAEMVEFQALFQDYMEVASSLTSTLVEVIEHQTDTPL
jgi:hypothetical protein